MLFLITSENDLDTIDDGTDHLAQHQQYLYYLSRCLQLGVNWNSMGIHLFEMSHQFSVDHKGNMSALFTGNKEEICFICTKIISVECDCFTSTQSYSENPHQLEGDVCRKCKQFLPENQICSVTDADYIEGELGRVKSDLMVENILKTDKITDVSVSEIVDKYIYPRDAKSADVEYFLVRAKSKVYFGPGVSLNVQTNAIICPTSFPCMLKISESADTHTLTQLSQLIVKTGAVSHSFFGRLKVSIFNPTAVSYMLQPGTVICVLQREDFIQS